MIAVHRAYRPYVPTCAHEWARNVAGQFACRHCATPYVPVKAPRVINPLDELPTGTEVLFGESPVVHRVECGTTFCGADEPQEEDDDGNEIPVGEVHLAGPPYYAGRPQTDCTTCLNRWLWSGSDES